MQGRRRDGGTRIAGGDAGGMGLAGGSRGTHMR
jgi:hypothetical protein